jgi:hypothetical protein
MPIATPQGTLDFKSVDKVTFVGASSNTVIDTTTGSLGVGVGVNGPTSNLHVVGHTRLEGDIDMLHTANTASIKLNSNVVTEFPRSKKLIRYPRVALTAASGESSGYQGYYVTESSNATVNTDRKSWKAFNMTFSNADADDTWTNDDDGINDYNGTDNAYTGTFNLGTGAVNGEWIKLQLPHKIRLEYMKIWLKDNDSTRIPEDWILYGSDDNTNWTELFSKTGQASINENQYSVNATSVYDYFAVVVTKISGQTNYFRIVELEYFGVPEYDPEAHGTDVIMRSVPNVPNMDWLEVYYDAKGLTGISSGVSDLSGNSINGVVTGATLSTDENIDIFNFNGQNDIIQGTFSGHTLSSGYTMATWIKPGVIGADDYIATFGVGSNGTSFGINFQTAEGAFRAFIWGSSTPGIVAQTNNGVVTKDKWVHIAATFVSSDGTIHLYIDNKLTATGTGTVLSSISASAPLVLGARNSGGTIERHANFKMANFRLFNRALTSDEVWQLYAYQKEYFGHGDLGMTLKAGRLGIGTSEPKATLDIRGEVLINGYQLTSMYPGFATGGDDVYDIDGYRIHVFTTSGTFVVPGKDITTDILLVGGGGGGGQDNAGGGGAGGLIFKPGHTFVGRSTDTGRDGAYTIVIGSGGTGSTDQNSVRPNPGGDTYIRPLVWRTQNNSYTTGAFTNIFTAKGGGPGNNGGSAGATTINGGSGGGQDAEVRTGNGGGVATQPTRSGDSGTYGYGNNGGNSADQAGGGGGGAGKAGENGSGSILGLNYGGYGGDGLSGASGFDFAEIFGTKYGEVVGEDVYFAGGGAGANRNVYVSFSAPNGYALGGKGGGGSAGGTPETNEDGLPGTGGGGAGATWVTTPNNYSYNIHGGTGGSGIVMIRYRL